MKAIYDMPNSAYHSHESYSKSNIVHAERSTQYVRDMRADPPEQTAAQAIGSAVHMLLLEPHKAEGELITVEAGIRRGKAWDKAVEEYKNCPDCVLILEKEWEHITPMVESVKQHEAASRFINDGDAEVSFFGELEVQQFKLPVKCRPDFLPQFGSGGQVITDLKTTRDITPKGFGKSAFNYHYHWSAWLTTKMLEMYANRSFKYYYVAVENKPTYETVVYQAMPWDIELAEIDMEPVLYSLAKAHCTGSWSEIEPKGVLPLSLPAWAYGRTRR